MADLDLRAVHGRLLGVLLEVDRVCRAHDIAYQLAAGTLLGAIRHAGFIPWDDDVDLCMTRAEYERFVAIAPAALGPAFLLRNRTTDETASFAFSKVLGEAAEPGGRRVFIDIFPFDPVRPDRLFGRLHIALAALLWRARAIGSRPAAAPRDLRGRLLAVAAMACRAIGPRRLNTATDWLARLNGRRDTGFVACLVSGRPSARKARPTHSLTHRVEVAFEGHLLPAPHNHAEVLTNLYGEYLQLPPLEKRRPTHLHRPIVT
jgi:lipopolysaccharide cholinephosphotransferase